MKRNTNCMEVREEFSALLDDELTLEEREIVEEHLSECAECLRELDALKQVDVAYSGLSQIKAPEGFEEGVRQAIRPRTLRFPALGRGRSARWMRPVAAMAALLLVMFGALLVLRQTDPERFQMAKVSEDETPDLKAKKRVLSSAPDEREEASRFGVSDEEGTPELSSAPAEDEKWDGEIVDAADALETLVRGRPNAPEVVETDAVLFRSRSKAVANKKEFEQDKIEALGYLGGAGAGGRLSTNRPTSDTAVPPLVPARAPRQESLPFRSDNLALSEGQGGFATADAARAVTMSEALQARDQVLGQPRDFDAGIAGEELRETAEFELGRGLVGGRVDEGERIAFDRFEDRVERTLNEAAPFKTVRVRSYKVGRDGVWVEEGYNGEATQLLKRGSPELKALVALDPEIKTLVQGTARAIFRVEGMWYTLEESKEGN